MSRLVRGDDVHSMRSTHVAVKCDQIPSTLLQSIGTCGWFGKVFSIIIEHPGQSKKNEVYGWCSLEPATAINVK